MNHSTYYWCGGQWCGSLPRALEVFTGLARKSQAGPQAAQYSPKLSEFNMLLLKKKTLQTALSLVPQTSWLCSIFSSPLSLYLLSFFPSFLVWYMHVYAFICTCLYVCRLVCLPGLFSSLFIDVGSVTEHGACWSAYVGCRAFPQSTYLTQMLGIQT